MTKSAWEVAGQLEREAQRFAEEAGRGREFQRRHRTAIKELEKRLDGSLFELAAALLPSLSEIDIARAGAMVGSSRGTIAGSNPLERREKDRRRAIRRIAEIDADPRWANRQSLRDPVVGSLPREIAELVESVRPLRAKLLQAAHPRLERLLESFYGTTQYTTPAWRLSYYQDWKAGDEVLEKFPEHTTFGTLRAELVQTQEALATLEGHLKELRRELETGEALERERGAEEQGLATIDERHLRLTREGLVGALTDIPVDAIAQRVPRDPTLDALLKRIAGQREQMRYLEELEASVLRPLVQRAQEGAQRFQRDATKWRRSKMAGRRIPDHELDAKLGRTEKLQKGWDRYDRAYTSVVSFDHYDAGGWGSDFLWWDIMTGGDRGHYVPSVAMFRTEHPEWRMPRHHEDDAEADAAAAALAVEHRRHGDRDDWSDIS